MTRPRIGEVLRKMYRLSELDVEEILHEQSANPQRFGEIALTWGMCSPQDVWGAWFRQLAVNSQHVDLNEVGVDSQAVAQVPPGVAMQFRIMPLRAMGNQLVAAIAEGSTLPAEEIGQCVGKEIRFVLAEPGQIDAALAEYYGPTEECGDVSAEASARVA